MTQSLAFPAFRKGKPITKKSWRQSVGLYCLLQCGLALNISVTPSQRSVLSLEMSAEGDEMVEPVLFPWCSSLWRGIPHGRELISVPWEKPLAQHISCPVPSTGIGWEGLSPMRRGDALVLTSAVLSRSSPTFHWPVCGWLCSLPFWRGCGMSDIPRHSAISTNTLYCIF